MREIILVSKFTNFKNTLIINDKRHLTEFKIIHIKILSGKTRQLYSERKKKHICIPNLKCFSTQVQS